MHIDICDEIKQIVLNESNERSEVIAKIDALSKSYQMMQVYYILFTKLFCDDSNKKTIQPIGIAYNHLKHKHLRKEGRIDYRGYLNELQENPAMLCPFAEQIEIDRMEEVDSICINRCLLGASVWEVCSYVEASLENYLKTFLIENKIEINHNIEDMKCSFSLRSTIDNRIQIL